MTHETFVVQLNAA